jgi:rhodanese-related sulfurtransferase
VTTTITVQQLKQLTGPERGQWIDVRSASEYATGHIPASINIPMEQIETRVDDLEKGVPIVLFCQGGVRAHQVARLLEPCGRDLAVLEGGTSAWIQAGLPVVSTVASRWSLERQVRLVAGALVVLGVVLALTWNHRWIYLAGFVGLGLTVAGLTNFCGMGLLLLKMPWNRSAHCRLPVKSADRSCCS